LLLKGTSSTTTSTSSSTSSTSSSSSSSSTTTTSTSSSTSSTSSSSSSSSLTTSMLNSYFSSTTTRPKTTTKYLFPNSFVLNAFPINTTIENQTIQVGLTDSIAFLPSIYSYDLNDLIDPFKLNYNYYCILADKYPGDFSLDLYSIKPNTVLTQVKINAANTCFKTNGSFFAFFFLIYERFFFLS